MKKLSIQETAERTGKAIQVIRWAIKNGKIKAVRQYGIWLVTEVEADRYKTVKRGRPRGPQISLPTNVTQSQLARKMGVSPQYISQLLNREAFWARQAVRNAIKAGKLTRPIDCENCGVTEKRIEAHHPDYSKPLDVEWLCSGCHKLAHPYIMKRY